MNTGERWLVIGAHDPFPGKNGSALRIRQHLETLKRGGADVFYWGISETDRDDEKAKIHYQTQWARRSAVQKLLTAPRLLFPILLGYDSNTTFLFSRKRAQDLKRTVHKFNPSHVLISESWMFRYARALKGSETLVCDFHNIESRLRLDSAIPWWLGRLWAGVRFRCMRRAELWFLKFSSQVWVCSQVDKDILGDSPKIKVVPNQVNFERYQVVKRTEDQTIGMVAIWSYGPNSQAADVMLGQVWPALRPDWTPVLIGKNPTNSMKDCEGAVVTGEVEDVRDHIGKIRIAVIPLLQGGGTRLKVLEAMAAGVPVVATPKAVEGLNLRHLEHCIISDPEHMAKWVRTLWSDPVLEERLRANARELVRESYSW